MAGKPSRFVAPLSESESDDLEIVVATSSSSRARSRAQAILWSNNGRSIAEIADLLRVTRLTVSKWFDRWAECGISGLKDAARSGAPPKLNADQQKRAVALLEKHPHSPKLVLQQIQEETGETISCETLARMARKAKRSWKRMRRSLKFKRNNEEFRLAKRELNELVQWHEQEEIDLYFGDQSGFSLIPTVPYGWLKVGEQTLLPSQHSPRHNVFGLLSRDQHLWTYQFDRPINSAAVIACLDDFSTHLRRTTVLVMDNASIHHSHAFRQRIPEWESQGLVIYHIPPYCPELNLIETLWRLIKHHWLPLSAYKNMDTLKKSLNDVFDQVGSSLKIAL